MVEATWWTQSEKIVQSHGYITLALCPVVQYNQQQPSHVYVYILIFVLLATQVFIYKILYM